MSIKMRIRGKHIPTKLSYHVFVIIYKKQTFNRFESAK